MSPDNVSTISKGYMARHEINIEYSLDISLGSEKYVKLITESIHLMQKHLRCKKVRPSKVESYLEVNA